MTVHLLHGLRVRSTVGLAGRVVADDGKAVDLVLEHAGVRVVPGALAEGRLVQGLAHRERLLYTTVEQADATMLLRIHGLVDFVIDTAAWAVRAYTDPACPAGMLGLLASGNLVAAVLGLQGETVLHASAVEVGGSAVAFVAHSGTGKSTLAALGCAAGARFVTDDLLRWHPAGNGAICTPGPPDNRLRRDVAELAGELAAEPTSRSADGRTVWRPEPTAAETLRLQAVVLPTPDRAVDALVLERVRPATAVLDLVRTPRILGWVDPQVTAWTFTNMGGLVRAVPVFRARIPWGPPFDPAVLRALFSGVGIGVSRRGTPTPAA